MSFPDHAPLIYGVSLRKEAYFAYECKVIDTRPMEVMTL